MDFARELIVEGEGGTRRIIFRNPMDLHVIRKEYARLGLNASILLAPDGVARVFFGEPLLPQEVLQLATP